MRRRKRTYGDDALIKKGVTAANSVAGGDARFHNAHGFAEEDGRGPPSRLSLTDGQIVGMLTRLPGVYAEETQTTASRFPSFRN